MGDSLRALGGGRHTSGQADGRCENGDMRNPMLELRLRLGARRPKNGDMRNSLCTKGMTPFPCFDQREELRAPFSSFKVVGHAQAQTCYSSDD
jgi:hypothetical protein